MPIGSSQTPFLPTGFIASHVAILLAKKYPKYKIVVYDKLDYCACLENLNEVMKLPNFKFVKGDITSPDLVNYVLREEKIDTILHFAARREHALKTILPALNRGDWVICDRFSDSTMAYQGYGHQLDPNVIEEIAGLTLRDLGPPELKPDLTIILDLDVEAGLSRAKGRGEGVIE